MLISALQLAIIVFNSNGHVLLNTASDEEYNTDGTEDDGRIRIRLSHIKK